MPGKLSRQAAERIKARQDAKLVLSHRLQLELRLRPQRAKRLAHAASRTFVLARGVEANAAELTLDELKALVGESKRASSRRTDRAGSQSNRRKSSDAASPRRQRTASRGREESKEQTDGGMAASRPGAPTSASVPTSPDGVPVPSAKLRKAHTDMWSGLSLVDEGLEALEGVAKTVAAQQKKEQFRRTLDHQRLEQLRFRDEAQRADEEARRVAEEAAEEQFARRAEALRRQRSRAAKFVGDVARLQDEIREQKLAAKRQHAEVSRSELQRVRKAARLEQELARARIHADRSSVRATQAANAAAMERKRAEARRQKQREMEEIAAHQRELHAREEERLSKIAQKKRLIQQKLEAMGGTFVDPMQVAQAAADKAEREMRERQGEQDARQRERQEHRRRVLEEERRFLLHQMQEHDEERRRKRDEDTAMLRRVEEDARAAAEEDRERRQRLLRLRKAHGRELVQQMQESSAAAMAPDDSVLERRLNNKVLKLKQAELEARAAEVLGSAPESVLRGSDVLDRVRNRAERLGTFSDSPLSSSAAGILRKLDATMERFASPSRRSAGSTPARVSSARE